jgi:hypothetical protein
MGIRQWMIWYAIILHWVWGVVLLTSPTALGVTAISTIVSLGIASSAGAGLLYITVASLSIIGVTAARNLGAIFLIPQTALLWLAAWGAIQAMVTGTFADGVVRDSFFLIADQSPAVVAAFFHTIGVLDNFFLSQTRK